MLSTLNAAHSASIEVGGRSIALTVSPVINDEGQRLGTVAELQDHTSEKLVENEFDKILQAAIRGDFTRRIEMVHKEGFFKQLGEGLNELLKTTESGFNDLKLLLYALSHYNLTVTITNDYSGCFAQTRYGANVTVKKLKEFLTQMKEAIDPLDKEMALVNNYFPHCSDEQAAQFGDDVTKVTGKGVEVMSQAVLKMDEINHSSRKIGRIIPVIDDIVLQLKMLAHTAAIEATRAGDQGGGFNAVAAEMSNLAQRTATAREEIKHLIDDSASKVSDGSKLVTQASLTIEEIVSALHDITAMMSGISKLSAVQMACIKEFNQAIGKWTI
jgi:methyl-accepting chemotaxis protein